MSDNEYLPPIKPGPNVTRFRWRDRKRPGEIAWALIKLWGGRLVKVIRNRLPGRNS